MPKKHAPAYSRSKPTYVHPSLQSPHPSTASAPAEPPSVNERIAQLRREQAPRATPEQRDELTAIVSNRTVPPHLRRILHLPEGNAPQPQPGRMRRTRELGAARPPPGPAAPSSWLRRSRHAPKYTRTLKNTSGGAHARFSRLASVTDDEFKRLPPPRSLQHHCLRTLAAHWAELSEYEQHHLPALPPALREAVLSYLTLYGKRGSLDVKSFKILFQDSGEGTTAWEDIRFLDLTELLNEGFTLNDLAKSLKRPTRQLVDELEQFNIADREPKLTGKQAATGVVLDSWEEDVDEDGDVQAVLPAQLKTPYFRNLCRLSLAHPGGWASWPDLLKASPHLNKLTHLSLAYWPRPTVTPNAVASSVLSKFGSVSMSGTQFYADLDDDWHEATNILRRFSANTYSLQWLDLEGCNWLRALSWRPESTQRPSMPSTTTAGVSEDIAASHDDLVNTYGLVNHIDNWSTDTLALGPDWNNAWCRIKYINLFQGWIPADIASLQKMPAGIVAVQLMGWLRENWASESHSWKFNAQETGSVVAEWVTREKIARAVAMEIQTARRSRGGVWCQMDHGWGRSGGP